MDLIKAHYLANQAFMQMSDIEFIPSYDAYRMRAGVVIEEKQCEIQAVIVVTGIFIQTLKEQGVSITDKGFELFKEDKDKLTKAIAITMEKHPSLTLRAAKYLDRRYRLWTA